MIIIQVLIILLQILGWAIMIKVLLSWLPMFGIRVDPYNPIVRFLDDVTEPILSPFRRFTSVGMMDFSPIIAFIIIMIVSDMLQSFLR